VTREPAVVAAPHHRPVINTPYAWLWPWRWDVDQRGQTTIPALRSASLEELNLSPQQQRQGVVGDRDAEDGCGSNEQAIGLLVAGALSIGPHDEESEERRGEEKMEAVWVRMQADGPYL